MSSIRVGFGEARAIENRRVVELAGLSSISCFPFPRRGIPHFKSFLICVYPFFFHVGQMHSLILKNVNPHKISHLYKTELTTTPKGPIQLT